MPPPGGPPPPCDGTHSPSKADTSPAIDLGYVFAATQLSFDGDERYDLAQHVLAAGVSFQLAESWFLRAGLGAILDGRLERGGVSYDLATGPAASVGATWRPLAVDGAIPFVDLSLIASASWARTTAPGGAEENLFATDLRLGARVGWLVWNRWQPYLTARAFGGPVRWTVGGEDVSGSDVHHYQVGAGMALQLGPLGLFLEGHPLGERTLGGGISWAL